MKLSLVIPAYNEAARLPVFLTHALAYLDAEFPGAYEILIVDDGSLDDTAAIAETLGQARPHLRVIRHPTNQGKGAAVRTGVMAARGELCLFADADGSTPIEEERRLRRLIEAGADLAIGSRAARQIRGPAALVRKGLADPVVREFSRHRYVLGRTFATLANSILGLRYADTQCGFKMFRREVGRDLFGRLTLHHFVFDVEILYLADGRGYQTMEIPVTWRDVPGSQVRLVRDSWRMFVGLWQIRSRHRSTIQRSTR